MKDVRIVVAADNKAGPALEQAARQMHGLDAATAKAGGGLRALGASAGTLISGGIAALGASLAAGLVLAVKDAAEAEAGLRKVSDVIAATGGAAGLTTKDIAAMSSELQRTTTFADDAINEMSATLLTFRNVSGDTFRAATKAALDMSTVLGTEPQKAAIQLGKALNDPISGMTALNRIGVQFSAAQKDVIRQMVETGNVAGAQKIIIQELADKFGGAAEGAAKTFGGRLVVAKNQLGELSEAVGGAITSSGAFNVVLDMVGGTLAGATTWVEEHKRELQTLVKNGVLYAVDAFRVLSAAIGVVEGAFRTSIGVNKMVVGGLQMLGGIAMQVGSALVGAFTGALEPLKWLARGLDVVGSGISRIPGMPAWQSLESKIAGLQAGSRNLAKSGDSIGKSWYAAGAKTVESGARMIGSVGEVVERYRAFDATLVSARAAIGKADLAIDNTVSTTKKAAGAFVDADGRLRGLNESAKAGAKAQAAHAEAAKKSAGAVQELAAASNEAGADTALSDLLRERTDLFGTFAEASREASTTISDAIGAIGDAFETATGRSIKGIGSLQKAVELFAGGKAGDGLAGALNIAAFVGSNIGGKAGSFVTGAASAALAGLQTGGPVGAAIGGVIGGVMSLFGGDDKAKAERAGARSQAYDTMLQSALSGGGYSRRLLASAGWTFGAVSEYRMPEAIAGKAAGSRLLADRGTEGTRALAEFVSVMDAAAQSVRRFASTDIAAGLEDIAAKYEYTIATAGRLAEVEAARIADLIDYVTGINASSVLDMIRSSVESFDGYASAGAAFAAKLTDAVRQSIMTMAISDLVNTTLMPMLQPALSEITAKLLGGSLAAGDMAGLIGQAQAAAEAIAPLIDALYGAFAAGGVVAGGEAVSAAGDLAASASALTGTVADVETATAALASTGSDMAATASRLADAAVNVAATTDTQEASLTRLAAVADKLLAAVTALHGTEQRAQTELKSINSTLSRAGSSGVILVRTV